MIDIKERTEYTVLLPEWRKARDLVRSERAVKARRTTYLPALSGHDLSTEEGLADYDSYITRASLTMYFKKIVNAFMGMLFRKPPVYSDDDEVGRRFGDQDALTSYIMMVAKEYLVTGRSMLMVEVTGDGSLDLLYYRPEQVIDWTDDASSVTIKTADGYLVLRSTPDGYIQEVYDADKELVETLAPAYEGKKPDLPPVVFVGGIDAVDPLLAEIIDLNMHHYRLSADYNHGIHWACIPTPVVSGVPQEQAPCHLGSSEFVVLPNPQAKAYYMEYSGQGLTQAESRLKHYEQAISALAIDVIGQHAVRSTKTATQAAYEYTTTAASLVTISRDIELAVNKILAIHAQWAGYDPITCTINRDFVSASMDAQRIRAIMDLYLEGTISYESFFLALQRGEIIREGADPDEERRLIATSPPPGQ